MTRPICFVDVETDGLGPGARVWEIGIVRREDHFSGTVDTEYRCFVHLDLRPSSDLKALEVGGFFDRHPDGQRLITPSNPAGPVAAKPRGAVLSKADAARWVMALTHDAQFVGANPAFDARALAGLLYAQELLPTWHYRLLDVEAMTYAVHDLDEVPGLRRCAEALDLEVREDQLHTAIGDARVVRDVHDALLHIRKEGQA